MRRGMGLIELLIGFLLLSILVACGLKATIVQREDGQLEHIKLEEAKQKADDTADEIRRLRMEQQQLANDVLDEINDNENDSLDESDE